jgi:hypothetical protein
VRLAVPVGVVGVTKGQGVTRASRACWGAVVEKGGAEFRRRPEHGEQGMDELQFWAGGVHLHSWPRPDGRGETGEHRGVLTGPGVLEGEEKGARRAVVVEWSLPTMSEACRGGASKADGGGCWSGRVQKQQRGGGEARGTVGSVLAEATWSPSMPM